MKYSFDLPRNKLQTWNELVKIALKHADKVQFNILFQGEAIENYLKEFSPYAKIKKSRKDKYYYSSKEVIELTLVGEVLNQIEINSDFTFWRNKCLEDPSFWIEKKEILACITHEDMVMADSDYFYEEIKQFDLYLHTEN